VRRARAHSTNISAIVLRFSRSSSYAAFIALTPSMSGESMPTADPGMSSRKKVSVSTSVSSTSASRSAAVSCGAASASAEGAADAAGFAAPPSSPASVSEAEP